VTRLLPNLLKAKKRGGQEIKHTKFGPLNDELLKIGKGKKYFIRTYGCQMNVHDSEHMAGILEQMNYTQTENIALADIILVNTCAIRNCAEEKVYGLLGKYKALKKINPGLILGLCGCMSQEEIVVERILKRHPYVDIVFGTHNLHRLPQLIQEALFSKEAVVEVWSKEGDIVEALPTVRHEHFRAWINVAYGCDKFCTYCIVPYTRGKERSRQPNDILQEIRDLTDQGYQEITLLGQNVTAYGKDLIDQKVNFTKLISEACLVNIPRIRFTTSHPYDFDEQLLDVFKNRSNLVEHIHLPVQSGSDLILKKMARKYSRSRYLKLVEKIRTVLPDVALTTDIIVGFPGETNDDFLQTMSLMSEVEFDSAFTFIYSARPGTPAAKMNDDIELTEKEYRLQNLNNLQEKISLNKNKQLVNRKVELLVEQLNAKKPGLLSGRTRSNKIVNFQGPPTLLGKLTYARITKAKPWSLDGELLEI
jgi:tRNA-2-methylthio-N6-dimethylallyladenosine synthase